jgi:Schlafen, AlbA_2
MLSRSELIAKAKSAKRESKYLDFKSEFDPSSAAAWCEVVKDVVACANSGGGVLVFGVNNDGSASGVDLSAVKEMDVATITNKIFSYTNHQFSEIELMEVERGSSTVIAMLISDSDVPMVFVKPGTYSVGDGKQKTAFSQGTVYFRHGAKSEPGNRDDFQAWRDRSLEKIRETWLGGIKKVVETPADHAVTVVSTPMIGGAGGVGVGGFGAMTATVSAGPGAIKIVPQNAEEIWPYRQKNLLAEVNKELGAEVKINGHDVQCVNREIDVLKKHPEFAYKPHTLASPQYSPDYVKWIVGQWRKDKDFFAKCREKHKGLTAGK